MTGAAIGVDVGGTKLEAIVLDAGGAPLWRRRVPTPAGDYAATLAAIVGLVHDAEAGAGCRGATVGLGTPGSAGADGRIKNANSTCLNGRPLQRDLEAALQRPLRLANDANCLALSEATDGAGAQAPVVFAAILGTGVGAGIAVHGRVLEGPNGLAGEWGHNPLPWAEPDETPRPCYCGRHGCIETWLSGPALALDHRAHGGAALDAARIDALARAGDAACAATLARYASRLARALAAVINLLDPDVIVLGGGLSRIDALLVEVPRSWSGYVFSAGSQAAPRTRLVRAAHGDASGVRGAARLWRERV
ncbi:MAG TPA: ROK family protein [Burkholderiaceae bacterium]